MGTYYKDYFNKNACAWCYFFLFPGNNFVPLYGEYLAVIRNGSSFPVGTRLIADPQNDTTKSTICSTLQGDECDMWTLCCNAAKNCCNKQLKEKYKVTNSSCRITWDGYACWDGGTPGKNSLLNCPNYLRYSIPTSKYILLIYVCFNVLKEIYHVLLNQCRFILFLRALSSYTHT